MADDSKFIEMYVHDAMFGSTSDDATPPCLASTRRGQKLVLPASASRPERERVVRLFEELFDYVKDNNQWVEACVCAAEEMQNMDDENLKHMVLLLHGKRTQQQQMANRANNERSPFAVNAGHHGRLTAVPEICVLCPRTMAQDEKSVLIVNLRQTGLQRVPIEHRGFDSMYLVLLFPDGYVGWEDNMSRRTKQAAVQSLVQFAQRGGRATVAGSSAMNPRDKLSMREYYAYRMHYRRGHARADNCIFMANRLFQEYACIAFWRVETARLQIHLMKQEEMRSARVHELNDFAASVSGGTTPEAIGRISFLPESFTGGPQDMYQKYHDAMAAVLAYGAPSLFITMTANPRWKEVLLSLPFDQKSSDRYDIISRVFYAKLKSLLDDLKAMLGKQVCRVYVIEFQKRGLPHAHIVVILQECDRPRTPDQVNSLSSAELPPMPRDDDHSNEAATQRKLRALVLEHMVHNDCTGERGPRCPCWDKERNRCGGRFPFDFNERTTMGDERQKACLRRRKGDSWTANANDRHITNQWVVPYNAALLLKYECHLNVEIVTASYAIKYLFKYLFKGADNASAAIHVLNKLVDQIGHYQTHRYLGSSEAFWRLFGFSIHDLTETVYRMVVEEPTERRRRYRKGSELEAALKEDVPKHVEAFIQFCASPERTQQDTEWEQLTVTSFPRKYTFAKGVWTRRKDNSTALGRMYAVHPNKGDAFYLRILLCSLVGSDVCELARRADEREDCCVCLARAIDQELQPCGHKIMCGQCALRVFTRGEPCPFCRAPIMRVEPVDEVVPIPTVHILKGRCKTFKDACVERGLLADDGEWTQVLEEAKATAMPEQMRSLFLHILCHCMPQEPIDLFDRFCEPMGDDFRRQLEDCHMWSATNVRTCVLCALRSCLDAESSADERHALSCLPDWTAADESFMQQFEQPSGTRLAHVYDYNEGIEAMNFEDTYERCKAHPEQQALLDMVIGSIESGNQLLTFVDAPGGCGKTYCFNGILHYLRSKGRRVLAVATTGIAALQLVGGKTVHTALKIPIDPTGSRRGRFNLPIDLRSALGKLIVNDLDTIVWDEAPMSHRDIFESVDYALRDLREDSRPFGGVNVLLGGDFRQCLPVVRGAKRDAQAAASILQSSSFTPFNYAHLSTNIRVELCKQMNPERSYRMSTWATELLHMGNGRRFVAEDEASEPFECNLPDIVNRRPVSTEQDVDDMISFVFGDIAALSKLTPTELASHESMTSGVLCPLHTSVDYINEQCLSKWEGDKETKYAVDQYEDNLQAVMVTMEQLNAHTPSGSPPKRLELKVGMPLILLRNMTNDLMNGTRMILLHIGHNVLKCMILTGHGAGRHVYLPRFIFKHEGPDQPLTWTRRQFPVKPCWAMTMNKSQGQTLAIVAICLIQIVKDGQGGVKVDAANPFTHGQFYVGLSRCGDPDRVCVFQSEEQYRRGTVVNVVYAEALPQPLIRSLHRLSDEAPADVIDDDVMYDARSHLHATDSFDVPYHGHVWGQCGVCWDGEISSIDDILMNVTDHETNQFIENVLNDATLTDVNSLESMLAGGFI